MKLLKKLLSFLIVTTPIVIHAHVIDTDNLPHTIPDERSVGYTTEKDAALAALALIDNTEFEYGGVIFELNGTFHFTVPVTINDPYNVGMRPRIPVGSKLVAMYHTHVHLNAFSAYPSENDVAAAKSFSGRQYIRMMVNNKVIVFDANKHRITRARVSGSYANVGTYDVVSQ